MVDVGDTAHDEERGWVDVKSGLVGLDEVNVAYQSGRTTQRMQFFRRRGSDPIHLHINAQLINNETRGMKHRTRFHIDVFPLLPEQVNPEEEYTHEQAKSGSNPDQRCADEIILGLVISPTAHAKAKVLEWPIERCGCQDVVLIWIWNQSVV